jgi:hypothetical protein
MDAMFTRWDPIAHLQTEMDQIIYLKACLDEDPGDGSLAWLGLADVARAPVTGSLSWAVRALLDQWGMPGDHPDPRDVVSQLVLAHEPERDVGERRHRMDQTTFATARWSSTEKMVDEFG